MHRQSLLLILLIACTSLPGCKVCRNAYRTVCAEPKLFNHNKDAKRSRELYLGWAREAWREVGMAEAECTSAEYRWGFEVGFADYVFAGGSGEPPPVPPREFWNVGWRSYDRQAAEEWFAGFRHGVAVAQAGGYRQRAVVPTSLTSGYIAGGGPAAQHAVGDELVLPSAVAEPVPAPPAADAPDPFADEVPVQAQEPRGSSLPPAVDLDRQSEPPAGEPAGEADSNDLLPDLEELLPPGASLPALPPARDNREQPVLAGPAPGPANPFRNGGSADASAAGPQLAPATASRRAPGEQLREPLLR